MSVLILVAWYMNKPFGQRGWSSGVRQEIPPPLLTLGRRPVVVFQGAQALVPSASAFSSFVTNIKSLNILKGDRDSFTGNGLIILYGLKLIYC